jgi:putative nucleotidyltransferase with HDIG domain
MRRFTRSIQAYIVAVILAGGVALFANLPRVLDGSELALLATLGVSGILAGIYRLPMVYSHLRIDLLGPVLLMAIVLTAPSSACILTALISVFASLLRRRRPWNVLFSASVEVLSVDLASALYRGIAEPGQLPLDSWQNALAFFVAATAYWLANGLLVFVLVAADSQEPLLRNVARNYGDMYLQLILMTLLSVLGTAAWHQGPLYAVLLFVPTVVIYQLLSLSKVKQEQVIHAAETIAEVLDRRNPFTFQHSRRVAEHTLRLAKRLGLTQPDCETLHRAALIHDIGKLGVEDPSHEFPPGKLDLSDYQFYNLKQHAHLGAMIAREIPAFEEAERPIRYHHDWFDGSHASRPHSGEEIPLGARIIAVADSYDLLCMANGEATLTYDPVAIEELCAMSGKQLDPDLLATFLEILKEEREPETQKPATVQRVAAV